MIAILCITHTYCKDLRTFFLDIIISDVSVCLISMSLNKKFKVDNISIDVMHAKDGGKDVILQWFVILLLILLYFFFLFCLMEAIWHGVSWNTAASRLFVSACLIVVFFALMSDSAVSIVYPVSAIGSWKVEVNKIDIPIRWLNPLTYPYPMA